MILDDGSTADLLTPDPPPAAPGKDDVTGLKAQLEAALRERDESRESEKFWAGQARRGGSQVEPAEEEAEDTSQFLDADAPDGLEGDTPEKMVDELAAGGVKALKARGFITAADAQKIAVEMGAKVAKELINRAQARNSSDNVLVQEFGKTDFGDVRDPKSELFQETAKRYQRAVAMDPSAKKTPAALYLAAEAALEHLKGKAAPKRGRDDDDYSYDDRPEPEDDRRLRAASQNSSRGRGARVEDDYDDNIGDQARQVMRDMGISEAEFRASMKATGGQNPRARRR